MLEAVSMLMVVMAGVSPAPPLPCAVGSFSAPESSQESDPRARARDLGIVIGRLDPGPLNAITDVEGVAVGHATIVEGEDARTGVTVIVRLGENTYWRKVPAAVYTANGYGKAAGFTQVEELGDLEAPIALTNTLSVGTVLEAMVAKSLVQPGNEEVRSVNVVVGETNDGTLNDIRAQHVKRKHVEEAWNSAKRGPVEEGCVGAGTGTRGFGYKAGIGTSSRIAGDWTVGVLVQTNCGRRLRIDGRPFPPEKPAKSAGDTRDGSCMIIVATDAPLDVRSLRRLAKRAPVGLARAGSILPNGSGDYVIAFSTYTGNVIDERARGPMTKTAFRNRDMNRLFEAVGDATEEAVLDSLFQARTTVGRAGHRTEAIDLDEVCGFLESR